MTTDTNPASPRFWLAISRGAGLVVVAVGATVLTGWLLDSAVLKSIRPDWVSMKANTAVGFVLSGLALWLKGSDIAPPHPLRSHIARACAGGVALLGLLTLVEYTMGGDLGIDQLLFVEPAGTIGTLAPGRMAPASALSFLLFGLALMLDAKTERGGRAVSVLAMLAGLPAMTSVLAYLYGSPYDFYGLGNLIKLAAHTAPTFLLLTVGLLSLRPERGMIALLRSRNSGGVIARRLLPAVIALPIMLEQLNQAAASAKLVESRFGVVLVDVVNIIVFAALILWVARSVSRIDTERGQANAAIRQSEERFRRAIVDSPFPIMIHAEDGTVIQLSDSWCEITGYTREELTTIGDWTDHAYGMRSIMVPGEVDWYYGRDGRIHEGDYAVRTRSGDIRIWDSSSAPLGRLPDGRRLLISMAMDLTEQRAAEKALTRKGRMYAVLSMVNKTIIHVADRQVLFDEICRIAVDLGEFPLAWVGGVDEATQRVYPVATAGDARDYVATIVVHVRDDLPSGLGPTGKAIREHRTYVCNDFLGDPHTQPWQEAAGHYGLKSSVALPLQGGSFSGALMVYAAERDYFDAEVVTLFEEVAADICFALQRLEDDRQRQQAEAQIRLHALVFNQSSEAMSITDADNNILMVNRAFTELTGYSLDEVRGRNPRLLQSGRQDRDFYRQMWAALQEHDMWQGELWNRRKNGEIFPEWTTVNLVRDENGRVVNHFAVSSDLSQHKAQEELYRLQRFDALTGLPNRVLLQDRIQEAIAHARQHDRYVALLCANLDHFRFINESLGQVAGDETLRIVAKRFAEAVGSAGTVSRLSGDTFVVLLDDLNETAPVGNFASMLLRTAAQPVAVTGTEVLLSACIGIALFPNDGADFDVLLQNASAALTKARENGRNSYYYFTQDLNERVRNTQAMAAELRHALEQGWFVLHYQPQVDTSNGEVTAVEALIRMRHPERGLIQPTEFITIAEETGMIVPIGAWVMREACRQLKRWREAGHDKLTMAINLSPLQFTDPQLFATIHAVIGEEGIDPHAIELEFTESAVMRNAKTTMEVMAKLRDMGVRLSIDDFGTGFSSLNYLKRFPIDRIKIDPSFVRNITTDPGDASIVQAIIAMARAMGVTTVAEGVETEAQAGYLRSLHCDSLQGYYLARPAPAEEIDKLLGSKQMVDRNAPTRALLVVDDEENVLHSLRRLLRGEGYRVLIAGSGEEALDLLGQNDVGVIMSDERMPGMTGTELLRRVRKMYPATVRIILSGYSDVSTITEAINKGEIYKYITKPWENEELVALLRKAFVRHEEELKAKKAKTPPSTRKT